MEILVYMFFVGICFVIFVLIAFLYKRRKTRFLIVSFYLSVALLTYSLICSLVYASSNSYSKKATLLYAEKDFLLGVDRIYLFKDRTFKIEYGDHLYHGKYNYENDLLILDIRYNFFLPFRANLPEVYKIIEGEFTDVERGGKYFGICKEEELQRL